MEKEKRDFIIKKGALGWGLLVAILWSIAMTFTKPEDFLQMEVFNLEKFLSYFIPAIIMFPIGGYFLGLWAWNYKKRIQERKGNSK